MRWLWCPAQPLLVEVGFELNVCPVAHLDGGADAAQQPGWGVQLLSNPMHSARSGSGLEFAHVPASYHQARNAEAFEWTAQKPTATFCEALLSSSTYVHAEPHGPASPSVPRGETFGRTVDKTY